MAEKGIELTIPALDDGNFEGMTLTTQLRVLEKLAHEQHCVLFGSSMGGYLAALYAQNHPKVERVVLLAPAFDFSRRWAERVGAEEMKKWRTTGQLPVFHYGEGHERSISYQLFEDAEHYPAFPDVRQPTLIFHGGRDDVVPPDHSIRFADGRPSAELHIMESGHELTNVMPEMWALVERFLFA